MADGVEEPLRVQSGPQVAVGHDDALLVVQRACDDVAPGRLDADTTGLILLTNDGELANHLTHPRYEVDKTYRARVEPAPVSEISLRQLREGVDLEDGLTLPASVRQVEPGVLELTIREGRKRQVRRMVEAVGHRVTALERTGFGPLRLDKLAAGDYRPLTPAEVERLRKAAGDKASRSRGTA